LVFHNSPVELSKAAEIADRAVPAAERITVI
jgi:hypothetical protein